MLMGPQYVVVLPGHLVQLSVHVAADGGTVLFDIGDIPYRIISVVIRSIAAASY